MINSADAWADDFGALPAGANELTGRWLRSMMPRSPSRRFQSADAISHFGGAYLSFSNNSQLSSVQITAQVRSAIESAKGKFVIEPSLTDGKSSDQQIATEKIRQSLAAGIRGSMLLAAMLAVAGALVAALTVSPKAEPST
jgi:hypothetical protein